MRSRFAALCDRDAGWLLASWHRSTRPATLGLNPAWRGLQIIDIVDGGPEDDTGVVEFRATYVPPAGGIEVMHERSRFVRENGCWYYVGPVR